MERKEPLLSVSKLTKIFGGVTAVEDVSFTVFPGQIVAVIGPNGAGKTTLFNMITNVLPKTSGTIHFDGHDTSGKKPSDLAKLGITRTFQNLQTFQNMQVVENVMTGAHVRLKTGFLTSAFRLPSVKKEEEAVLRQAMQHLQEVGLADLAHEIADNLPYGSQRLLEIARAAASEPQLILLDEPMAGLNPQESRDLMRIILDMRAKGMTFLFVEHDMETVMTIADHIVVLDFGKKIAEGTPEEIMNNPQVISAYLGEKEVVI
ncbi:ABC transporter ATP-binding protein [Ferviditalea candida]|uniref:ABC transporter ATP-binding protein n=1 Tax=Ferviditalea candida TaxID=3108399 RepID=A0ABU5ZHK3_9BACL|nr:ABC transporter ATP-binding protein [Paenibacillaceae bacterium T2]